MVATVLSLRYRLLGNMLSSSPMRLIGYVFGILSALGFLAVTMVGLAVIGASGLDAVRGVMTMGGTLIVLGWSIAPLLAGGVDTSVGAEQLTPFPMSIRQIMVSITLVGLLGIPGIATSVGALGGLLAWGRWPVALVASVVCLPLGVLTCVLASRTVASFSSRGRGVLGNVIGIIAFGALVLAGPIATGLMGLLNTAQMAEDEIGAVIDGLAWTPAGAIWAVPGDLAAGEYLSGVAKALIGVATLAVLWLLWRRNVVLASVSPQRHASPARVGKLGWVGRAPSGATGAGWARSTSYWFGDPRYLRNLMIVAALPVVFAFAMNWQVQTPIFAFSVVVPALLLGLVPYADVSYDGTAFSTLLATGIRGRDDRAGRMLGALTAQVPVIVVVAAVTTGFSGHWMLLPAVLGCALGSMLAGLGICAISSAYLIIPVPEAGDNLFKRVPGQSFWVGLALMGLTILAAVLTAPALGLAIVAVITGAALWSWLALAAGLVVGGVLAAVGVVVGGRIFDRTAPDLLARIRVGAGY